MFPLSISSQQAFYNPSPNGGIMRTTRAPDITAPTARFPFEVTLHQGAIENIFRDSIQECGVVVEQGIVPSALDLKGGEGEWPVKVRVILMFGLECWDACNGVSGE